MPHATATVFIVDDDVSVRESLELLIGSAGWQAEIFASAEEFLSRPRLHGPSCLILDVNLPDLNGLELQRRIALDRIDMPIIFITGYATDPHIRHFFVENEVKFLVKPFPISGLISCVKQLLG